MAGIRSSNSLAKRVLSALILTVIVIWSFGPIAIAIVSSFKNQRDIFTYVPTVVFEPTLGNYATLLDEWSTFWRAMGVSTITTLGSAALVVLVSLPAAYAYSRMARPAFAISALFLIAVRMFPPIIITIPLFPIFTGIGLTDTPLGLIFVYASFMVSISVLLLKVFIDGVPREVDEAAMLDGASRLKTFVHIMLPQIAPGIAASIIFVTLFAWNDFLFSFLLAGTKAKTAPVMIAEMMGAVGEGAATWGTIFAASVVQLAPILLFVWLIQKPLLRGFQSGGSGK
ncbi:MAG: carbohydrate ABC transporter permease [Proteobacteria bacterium]|nr:carbohydrate ABC transporter permease [Pseudomonadota bacterium]